ncbi:FtsX-like permease family protein [Cohnella sp. CFH 77786]|uniref:permease-like cell division protein FtsX n=1 Tax=Cohnella sp. CFH 77786 TaxID=2662265 RepID=UPI001C60C6A9|nr:permease-like cell division protein FtsX [Cohnella sp. CFH 77786]MBW5448437.1 FtsX-like permease family protein [Cohnella sp. CFH 77786]
MRFSTLVRHLREGGKNVARNGWMTFASVSSITVSLFILGVFMLLALNVNKLADQLDNQVQIRVYLKLDLDRPKIEEISRTIRRIPELKSVTFVSKAEGLKRLRDSMDEESRVALEGYTDETNPLPDAFEIEVYEPQTVAFAAKKIQAINETDPDKPITAVKYGAGTVEKLFRITNAVRNIGFVIVAGLAVMAMFLISTTIKMTIMARRREIAIMKMVGATNNFIRWPFFVEGVLIGMLGSAVTTAILLYGYSQLITTAQQDIGLYMIELASLKDVGWIVTGAIVAMGLLLGIWGSTLSVRKYLKV